MSSHSNRMFLYTGRKEFERHLHYICEELSKNRMKLDVFNELKERGELSFSYKNFLKLTNSDKYPELARFKRGMKKNLEK